MEPEQQPDKKFSGQEILRDLIPLNALGEDRYREITAKLVIRDVNAGSYLFGEGDRDNRSIYLLDGVVNFIDEYGKVTGVVSAGTDPARYPLANQQPRITTARCATKSVIASIDSTLLDVMLTLDQSGDGGTSDPNLQAEEEWMKGMLKSEAFSRMAPADIQRLIKSLQSVQVAAGDPVIKQGDDGDYYYIIREGSCSVTRLASGRGWDVPLAELGPGDCFGEDALVSDSTRNATVTMLTDGTLMRLSKHDFIEIMKKPMVLYTGYNEAVEAVTGGSMWVDVRTADEHAAGAFKHAINLPLASMREGLNVLDATRKYILYCDTGRRSAAAAFLLGQKGFEVTVLEGGLKQALPAGFSWIADEQAAAKPAAVKSAPAKAAEKTPDKAPVKKPAPATDAVVQPAAAAVEVDSSDVGTLKRKLKTTLEREQATRARLDILQNELVTLRGDLKRYTDKVMQVEVAHESERLAREKLTDRLERLLGRFDNK